MCVDVRYSFGRVRFHRALFDSFVECSNSTPLRPPRNHV